MATSMARRKGWKIRDGKAYHFTKLTWQEENAGKLACYTFFF
jgi:hypothetical protein